MSENSSWHVAGHLEFRGSPSQLADALSSAGLVTKPGRYAARIADCSHFVLRCVDNPEVGGAYEVDADADSETEMVDAAGLVSKGLRAASIIHDFEVLSPGNEVVKQFTHNG
jgi:hypothetical protein